MGQTESIRELAEPIAARAGLEVWDVEVGGGVVRVLLDRSPDNGSDGVDLDALADASRALSARLDEHDELVPGGRYHLEVSSPGIERNLRTVSHYLRYQGAEVAVKLKAANTAAGGVRRLRGTLTAADEEGIRITAAEPQAGQAELEIPYGQIERTRTVLVWGPASKPGRPRAGAAPHAKDAP